MVLWLRLVDVAAMIAVIVAFDVSVLRHHVWARLVVNVGVVALFLAVFVVAFHRG
ncbi:hypothetical protein [Alicyclobacillus sendaiensis]|uniref:hypothetical protein n=1 Tax=Alicyclobacillus sendaiensis TaxID=192387 RepID=UPI000A44B5A2|nr:hypothetical protein [Alicyclobacillus sendaiensis]